MYEQFCTFTKEAIKSLTAIQIFQNSSPKKKKLWTSWKLKQVKPQWSKIKIKVTSGVKTTWNHEHLRTCCTSLLTSSFVLLSSASRMGRRVSSCWTRWLSSVFVLFREASFSLKERTCWCSSSSRCSNSFLSAERFEKYNEGCLVENKIQSLCTDSCRTANLMMCSSCCWALRELKESDRSLLSLTRRLLSPARASSTRSWCWAFLSCCCSSKTFHHNKHTNFTHRDTTSKTRILFKATLRLFVKRLTNIVLNVDRKWKVTLRKVKHIFHNFYHEVSFHVYEQMFTLLLNIQLRINFTRGWGQIRSQTIYPIKVYLWCTSYIPRAWRIDIVLIRRR